MVNDYFSTFNSQLTIVNCQLLIFYFTDFRHGDVLESLSVVLPHLEAQVGQHPLAFQEVAQRVVAQQGGRVLVGIPSAQLLQDDLAFVQIARLGFLALHGEAFAAFHYFQNLLHVHSLFFGFRQ